MLRPETYRIVIQARYDDEGSTTFAYDIKAFTPLIAIARAGQKIAKLHGATITDCHCEKLLDRIIDIPQEK